MSLEVRIAGPDLDVAHNLSNGAPELVLGRDDGCDVCLPDPERNVSRRHLALWAAGGELHFRVLSEVNGVEMPFGEAPPGARGVLPLGQRLKVGLYEVSNTAATQIDNDPWAVFDREGSGIAPVPAALTASPEADPFGDWGFEASGAMEAASLAAGDVSAFFQGLGIEAGSMTRGELEAMGRLVRVLVLGILDLHAEVADVKQELHSEDRTMVAASRDNNPLKTSWPVGTKLRYLFGGQLGAAGYMLPERALRELIVDLVAHNAASAAAARSAIAGTLSEHAPAALKAKLIGDGVKIFESAQAWDAFCKYYDEQGADLDGWAAARSILRRGVPVGKPTCAARDSSAPAFMNTAEPEARISSYR
jgi:predicted component of type VI protein secretion system